MAKELTQEQLIKQLETDLANATNNAATANEKAASLENELFAVKESLKKTHENFDDACSKLALKDVELNDALEINKTLVKEVETLSVVKPGATKAPAAAAAEKMTFENNGDTYGFKWPKLTRNKAVITQAEVCANTDLQNELIAANSNWLKKL